MSLVSGRQKGLWSVTLLRALEVTRVRGRRGRRLVESEEGLLGLVRRRERGSAVKPSPMRHQDLFSWARFRKTMPFRT